MELGSNGMCFGCGSKNPMGLKLQFKSDGELFCTKYTPGPEFQGYAGVIHGGIISTLLDEVMANHLLAKGLAVVTAELQVRFLKPVKLGVELKIVSNVLETKSRLSETEGWIENEHGEILARAKAKMMHVVRKE